MGTFDANFTDATTFNAELQETGELSAGFGEVQKVSTSNYEELYNHPYMNDRKIIGRKTSADYGLQDKMNEITPQMIDNLFYGR